MQNENNHENLDKLFAQAYKKLGKRAFVYISPTSLDPEIEIFLPRFERQFRRTYRKNKQIIDQFIAQVGKLTPIPILDLKKEQLSKPTLYWLTAINQYFQMRWDKALPELAEYGIEFFIPPATDKQKAEYKVLGIEETDLKATIQIDLPYSVVLDEKGGIDMAATQNFEQSAFLIRSKLAGLTRLRYASSLLTNKLRDFPIRPFFVINHYEQIEQLAGEIVQRVFDNMMHYAYSDLQRGISPQEARKNSFDQILDMSQKRQLEELVVFRASEDMAMDLYILEVLDSLRELNDKIKQETLDDFYKHIFISLTQVIDQKIITPGGFFVADIREASDAEIVDSGHEYTLEIQSVTETGDILEGIKEYYKFILTDRSFKDLLVHSTNGFEPSMYFM